MVDKSKKKQFNQSTHMRVTTKFTDWYKLERPIMSGYTNSFLLDAFKVKAVRKNGVGRWSPPRELWIEEDIRK